MAAKKTLTVLVPIKDSDCSVWDGDSVPAASDFPDGNTIYKFGGVYYRLVDGDVAAVVDREFPEIGNPLLIGDYTYSATRMGQAPTISASAIMEYATKDGDGHDITLSGLWKQQCHVVFNGERFYIKGIPTAEKTNEDARYKYDNMIFVAERSVLETVYFYDIVRPFITERYLSENESFSFYGGIEDLVKRINANLLSCGLASLDLRDNASESVHPRMLADGVTKASDGQYFSYQDWNDIGLGEYDGPLSTDDPYNSRNQYGDYDHYHNTVYDHYNGDYDAYLRNEVFKLDGDGNLIVSGYYCKIGTDAKGARVSSEDKLAQYDKNTIYEALESINKVFELQYYISGERDGNGEYTGNTIIWVSDCEHDFADVDGDGLLRDADGIPTTTSPFDYGFDDALLSKGKTDATEKIVTRCTGKGSTENIPWYYPNPTADGWIKPVYIRGGDVQSVNIGYPLDEGTTTAASVRYEKFLKNRIGDAFKWGIVKQTVHGNDYKGQSGIGYYTDNPSQSFVHLIYAINVKSGFSAPFCVFKCGFLNGGNAGRVRAVLIDNTAGTSAGEYDSAASYSNPTDFQRAWMERDGSVVMGLTAGHIYYLYLDIDINGEFPSSNAYDYSGYYYQGSVVENGHTGPDCIVPDGFYTLQGLVPTAEWQFWSSPDLYIPRWGGYSIDGSYETRQTPITRQVGKKYKDLETGIIYECSNDGVANYQTGENKVSYTPNPSAGYDEWVSRFMDLRISILECNGWYRNSIRVELADYGLTIGGSHVPQPMDSIEFRRVKYVTPQKNLMPEIFIKTDGERRFYNAIDYPVDGVTADAAAGEVVSGGSVTNQLYLNDGGLSHYRFENEYMRNMPKEHIEEFDDVKPSIKGQTNYISVSITEQQFNINPTLYYIKNAAGGYRQCYLTDTFNSHVQYFISARIDIVEEFAYDELDNDEIWENGSGSGSDGEYKHPYFFAKLRPLGFNIFDLALQEDMVVSMTTGHCGACNFKIGVDEKTKKNPVQVWEYDVYGGDTFANKGARKYKAGDLRRYVDTSNLYYDTDGTSEGYKQVDYSNNTTAGFLVGSTDTLNAGERFRRETYSAEDVINGSVGSLRQDGKSHFAGDVKTSGRFIESQQDTSENYVWVALMKDVDTYGVIMPSARPSYASGGGTFIEPKGHIYTDRSKGANAEDRTSELSDDEADKFVLLNIRMPIVYVRRAEHELSRRIVKYMYENNYHKFNFSIRFSRIFFESNIDALKYLNENSVLYIRFDGRIYRQYVSSFSYKVSASERLPEVEVQLHEELGVHTDRLAKFSERIVSSERGTMNRVNVMINAERNRTNREFVSSDGGIIYGDVVMFQTGNSIIGQEEQQMQITLKNDEILQSISDINVFNDAVTDAFKQVRNTVQGSANNRFARWWSANGKAPLDNVAELVIPVRIVRSGKENSFSDKSFNEDFK